MVDILYIIKYFGFDDPEKVYQTINQDILLELIHIYYEENPIE